jgi:hypothetical protein
LPTKSRWKYGIDFLKKSWLISRIDNREEFIHPTEEQAQR